MPEHNEQIPRQVMQSAGGFVRYVHLFSSASRGSNKLYRAFPVIPASAG